MEMSGESVWREKESGVSGGVMSVDMSMSSVALISISVSTSISFFGSLQQPHQDG